MNAVQKRKKQKKIDFDKNIKRCEHSDRKCLLTLHKKSDL